LLPPPRQQGRGRPIDQRQNVSIVASFSPCRQIVNTKLVKKLVKKLGIAGLPGPRKGRPKLVNVATCEDLVQRNFTAGRPHELWLTELRAALRTTTEIGQLSCPAMLARGRLGSEMSQV